MTVVKIEKLKKLRCFTRGSGHGKLVQLVFVNHMSNLTKFYFSVSFARQYIIYANYLPLPNREKRVHKPVWHAFSCSTMLNLVRLFVFICYAIIVSPQEETRENSSVVERCFCNTC